MSQLFCFKNTYYLLIVLSFSTSLCFADCYITWNCGSSWQCAQLYGASSGRRGPLASCAGWVKQDADQACTCGPTTGVVGAPAGGDPATELGHQMGNMLWQKLTTPEPPKSAEQIEADRQAELLRQQQEAERQAKIQKYLSDEAAKQQQKNAALDQEAQDSMSLLDHKPAPAATMSDDELLGAPNDRPAPSLCTDELHGLSNDLNAFADEAQKEGVKFAVDDGFKTTRASMGDAAAGKIGMRQYAKDYKTLKADVDKVKKQADSIAEVKKCVDTKGCSLIDLSEKVNRELREWVKSLGTQGLQEAADRVDKAAAFYQDYTKRLEQHNEKITNGAAKCLAN